MASRRVSGGYGHRVTLIFHTINFRMVTVPSDYDIVKPNSIVKRRRVT